MWQFILSWAHKSSWGNLEDSSSAGKAPGGWRSPRRFAQFGGHRQTRQRLGLRQPSAAFSRGMSNRAIVNWNCHNMTVGFHPLRFPLVGDKLFT
jgi:hypothetical protein